MTPTPNASQPAAATSLANTASTGPGIAARVGKRALAFARSVVRVIGTLLVLGLSLLPLSALLVALAGGFAE